MQQQNLNLNLEPDLIDIENMLDEHAYLNEEIVEKLKQKLIEKNTENKPRLSDADLVKTTDLEFIQNYIIKNSFTLKKKYKYNFKSNENNSNHDSIEYFGDRFSRELLLQILSFFEFDILLEYRTISNKFKSIIDEISLKSNQKYLLVKTLESEWVYNLTSFKRGESQLRIKHFINCGKWLKEKNPKAKPHIFQY